MLPRTGTAVTVIAVFLVGAVAPAAGIGLGHLPSTATADVGTTSGSNVSSTSSQTPEFSLSQELRLTPERPGEIEVRLRYAIPDRVTALTTRVPADATVTAIEGFDARDGAEFDWNGRTVAPTITYRLPANETGRMRGPEGADGRYLFVDVGEWALVERPRVATSWRWSGAERVDLSRNATVDGPGAVGETMAFLGESRELRSTAHGQTFRLVVPDAADLAEPPRAVFAALGNASDALRVGDRDETVFVVVAPGDVVEWGARGLQVGDADMWVRDDERLDDPGDTWTHEYVHTRQSFETTTTGAWVTEATATYYAALLAHEDGRVGFESLADWLSLGARSPYGSAVLADPTTWRGVRPDYLKGALVMGELDRRIRLRTGHERSAQALLRRMNERDRPVNGSAFVELVGTVGGDDLRLAAVEHSTTSAAPEMWSRTAHERAFGPSPALIDTGLVDRRIAGPYRNVTAHGSETVLAVGETLSFDVRVENRGGTAGPYDVPFRVDGTVEASRDGRLGPDESRIVTFDRRFDETGTSAVAAGDERVTVRVVEPATADVTDVRVSASSVRPGDTVTISATVSNAATIPGEREVILERDGEFVTRRTVRLGPGTSRTVSLSTTLESVGDHRLGIGNETVVVRVGAATETATRSSTAAPEPSPGDGITASPGQHWRLVASTLIAVATLVTVRRLRRRRA